MCTYMHIHTHTYEYMCSFAENRSQDVREKYKNAYSKWSTPLMDRNPVYMYIYNMRAWYACHMYACMCIECTWLQLLMEAFIYSYVCMYVCMYVNDHKEVWERHCTCLCMCTCIHTQNTYADNCNTLCMHYFMHASHMSSIDMCNYNGAFPDLVPYIHTYV
jgi:hypothetical protein